jgi:hypothetical protein
MLELGPVGADEMVLAFLRAEVDSPRFRNAQGLVLRDHLRQAGLDPNALIDKADLGDLQASAQRREILRWWRGYGDDKLLFRGLPIDVSWRRVRLRADEIGRIKYCDYPAWLALSGPSRLVADGAASVDTVMAPENLNAHIAQVADRVRRGDKFPELILVQTMDCGLILVEGHTRATAYVVAPVREPIDALVGTSQRIMQWAFHG